jgi:hypothetical protein
MGKNIAQTLSSSSTKNASCQLRIILSKNALLKCDSVLQSPQGQLPRQMPRIAALDAKSGSRTHIYPADAGTVHGMSCCHSTMLQPLCPPAEAQVCLG